MSKPYREQWGRQYMVAFGTEWPEEFATDTAAFEYLTEKFEKHGRGCFSLDGPNGNWANYYVYEMWCAVAGNVERFNAYYEMVGDGEGV